MRVPVSQEPLKDEKGAVAVLVGILAIFLIGLSAFTIDLGSAYVSNRNLQRAADAGALAGAQSLSKVPGTCNSILSDSAEVAKAKAVAVDIAKKNYPDGVWTESTWEVRCDATSKSLLVKLGNAGTTRTRFAGVFGGQSEVTTSRAATATVEVAQYAGTAMRPLAVCSTQLTAGPYVRLDYPTDAPPACGNASGAWWTVDCPSNPSNSTAVMVQQVKEGCPRGASVITGQTSPDPTSVLTAACKVTAADGTCLESNPGNLDSGQVAASWKYLVDQQTPVIFPVFCAPPQCSTTTIDGEGNNATFPVYKLLGAVLCGYHFSKKDDERYAPSAVDSECEDMPTDLWTAEEWDSNSANFLIIKYATVSTSGSNTPTECGLGSTTGCDGGARRTRLVE